MNVPSDAPWRTELLSALVQPALLIGSDEMLIGANGAARALFRIVDPGPSPAAAVLDNTVMMAALRKTRATGAPVTVDTDHGEHHLQVTASTIGDDTLLMILDRTQERQVEELRRDFVVNASHELKTPVTSIQTLAEALAVVVTEQPDRVPLLVSRLSDEAERLGALVADLLDLRRLEERGSLEREPVDLAELIRRVVSAQYSRAEKTGVELSVDAPDRALLAGVAGDLEVIVKNLVVNAIKYNRPGGTVLVRLVVEDGRFVLTVSDTGIGIPQGDLRRVFERFYRVDTARSRETGGTGLGLSIARHAVEHHGGTIAVDSELDAGTTFTVALPTTQGARQAARQGARYDGVAS